ncbi:uncharacterized protein LOC124405195 isoform X2 [Diprion similis]|uniref:uncharacterized protein LOC124405195 isoform X2 n=1 Tax=Diprion similis TaxID=362088 RepID=UPI001EF85526|nr:uncharacterized protein LOC124405195 isoform X2 [Diprion similis]
MEYEKSFKRKMLLWTSNWLNQEDPQTEKEVPFTPDAVEIARLLVATGYRVRFMDRCLPKEMYPVAGVPAGSPACRVTIMCPHSGLRMELEAATSSCNCPPPPYGLDKSWTAGEPDSERMEEAVEFTIGRTNQEISKTISQFIAGLLKVSSKFSDVNHNDEVTVNTESTVASMTEVQEVHTQSVKSDCVSSVKTPAAAGITVVTPCAPCIPKASPSDGKTAAPGRYRSLDTLIGSGGFADDLPEPGPLTPKEDRSGPEMAMDVDTDPDATIVEGPPSGHKKFISKSSPAVNYTEQFQRSDTFVFEEPDGEEKKMTERTLVRSSTFCVSDDAANDTEKGPRLGPPPSRTPSPLPPIFSQSLVLTKLQDVQQIISDIIVLVAGNQQVPSSIGDVSKASKAILNAVQRVSDNVRPIRSLSDFGSVPNLTRDGTTARSIARPQIRRYATTIAAPATPTSSRREGISLVDRSKRASTTMLSNPAGTAGKTQTTSKAGTNRLAPPANGRSTTTLPSSTSGTTTNRKLTPVKKYANVQSSIPKPSIPRK